MTEMKGTRKVKPFCFEGKHVLVTGGSSGIGYAVAAGFVTCKANVTILANNDGVHAAAERLSDGNDVNVKALQCDIADSGEVNRAIADLSRVDVLINNAGIERVTPIDDTSEESASAFRRVIDVNILGSYLVTRGALALMPDGSRIIFTASTWGKSGYARMAGYCASKHATIGLMRVLAHELGPRSITVNSICPGWVRTEQSMSSIITISKQTGRSVDEISGEILGSQAISGFLEPEDMVNGYLFLASDMARDITGQSLHIDRGELMD